MYIPHPEFARPRKPREVIFAVGGWSGLYPTSVIETYDPRADRWINVRSTKVGMPSQQIKILTLHFAL